MTQPTADPYGANLEWSTIEERRAYDLGVKAGRRLERERLTPLVEAAKAVALLDELHYSAEPCVDDLIAALTRT